MDQRDFCDEVEGKKEMRIKWTHKNEILSSSFENEDLTSK